MTTIEKKFNEFDQSNPEVWRMFQMFAHQMAEKGHQVLSSKLIFERMRWETMMRSTDPDYKLNNNYTAYYARKWNREFPFGPRFVLRFCAGQEEMDLQS